MSALVAPQRTSSSRPREQRALKPVPSAPKKRSNAPFIALVGVVLGAGMAGAIVLNTAIEQQSRTLVSLQRDQTALINQEAMLTAQVNELRSPRVLALKASDLGMVPNPHPAYIDLATGEIIGTPKPVGANDLPNITGGLR